MGMGTLAGLARLKSRAASVRRTLATRPPLNTAGEGVTADCGRQDLGFEVCRTTQAVLQGWGGKVFPGEGKGCESARNKTFSGKPGNITA